MSSDFNLTLSQSVMTTGSQSQFDQQSKNKRVMQDSSEAQGNVFQNLLTLKKEKPEESTASAKNDPMHREEEDKENEDDNGGW